MVGLRSTWGLLALGSSYGTASEMGLISKVQLAHIGSQYSSRLAAKALTREAGVQILAMADFFDVFFLSSNIGIAA